MLGYDEDQFQDLVIDEVWVDEVIIEEQIIEQEDDDELQQ